MRRNNRKSKRNRRRSGKRSVKIPRQITGAVMKYKDINFGATLLTTGNVLNLTPPTQGTAANQRIGDSIFIHHVDIVLNFRNEGATSNYMRFGLLSFKGFTPSPSLPDFLSPGPSLSIDVLSLFIPYFKTNFFKVIWDKLYTTCPNSNTDLMQFRGTKRINMKTTFTPGTNFQVSNTLTFFAISDSAVIPSPRYDIQFRMWYSDSI
jgi:hypothetical protein